MRAHLIIHVFYYIFGSVGLKTLLHPHHLWGADIVQSVTPTVSDPYILIPDIWKMIVYLLFCAVLIIFFLIFVG